MEKCEYLEKLLKIECSSALARRFKDLLVRTAQADASLEKLNGKLNISSLSRILECDRQLFYPGRGNAELVSLINLANLADDLTGQDHQQAPKTSKKARSRYKTEFQRLADENSRLKLQLSKFSWIDECLSNGKVISLPPC